MKRIICLLSLFVPLISCNGGTIYTVNEAEFNNAIINKGKEYVQTSEEAFFSNDRHGLGKSEISPGKYYSIFNIYSDEEETPSEFEEVYTEIIDDINCRYISRDQSTDFSDWATITIEKAREDASKLALPCDLGLKNLLALQDVDNVSYNDFTYDKVNKEYHATYNKVRSILDCYIQFENKATKKIKFVETDDNDTDIRNYYYTYEAKTPKDPRK